MTYCPHCQQPIIPDDADAVKNNGHWWHEACLEEALAELREDQRLDDPRHEPKS